MAQAVRWSDNLLAEIIIDQKYIQGVILYFIPGRGRNCSSRDCWMGSGLRPCCVSCRSRALSLAQGSPYGMA